MKPKPTESPGAVKWQEQPLEWPRSVGQVDGLLAALKVRERRQRRRRIATAAGAATLLAIGGLFFLSKQKPSTAEMPVAVVQRYRVIAPEHRTLPDGSVVDLRYGSELAVNFSANSGGARRVALTKGEAVFEVARNPARPFIVAAGGVEFRAIGTAFDVDVSGRAVEMLVTEGRVAVGQRSSGSEAREALATVPSGNRVMMDPERIGSAPDIIPTTDAEIAQKLAWRFPRIEFNESPLWEVVSLLHQHSGSHIALASPEIQTVKISGLLRADNVEPLLQMLVANYGIRVVREGNGQIVLHRAN